MSVYCDIFMFSVTGHSKPEIFTPRFNLGLLIPRLFNLEILTPDSHGVETFMAEWSRVEMSGVEIYTL